MMTSHECRHIKANGYKCNAKSLRGFPYCYFHDSVHRQRSPSSQPDTEPLYLPFPEDRAAILLALDEVFEGICSKKLSTKEASLLLSGLRIAARTVDRKDPIVWFSPVESVDTTDSGHELGPEKRPCSTCDDCSACPDRDLCSDYDPDEAKDAGFDEDDPEEPVAQPEQNPQVESPVPMAANEDPPDENSNPPAEKRKPAAAEKKPPATVKPVPMPAEPATLPSLQAVASAYQAPNPAGRAHSGSALQTANYELRTKNCELRLPTCIKPASQVSSAQTIVLTGRRLFPPPGTVCNSKQITCVQCGEDTRRFTAANAC